jgi:hypothetical protein
MSNEQLRVQGDCCMWQVGKFCSDMIVTLEIDSPPLASPMPICGAEEMSV